MSGTVLLAEKLKRLDRLEQENAELRDHLYWCSRLLFQLDKDGLINSWGQEDEEIREAEHWADLVHNQLEATMPVVRRLKVRSK